MRGSGVHLSTYAALGIKMFSSRQWTYGLQNYLSFLAKKSLVDIEASIGYKLLNNLFTAIIVTTT